MAYRKAQPKRAICMDCGVLGIKDTTCQGCGEVLTWGNDMAQLLAKKIDPSVLVEKTTASKERSPLKPTSKSSMRERTKLLRQYPNKIGQAEREIVPVSKIHGKLKPIKPADLSKLEDTETVEQFMARGGKVEALRIGATGYKG